MKNIYSQNRFEHLPADYDKRLGRDVTETIFTLGTVAMQFAGIDRVPRYSNGDRENDVEHSYMLALVAPEVAETLGLDLDKGLISRYAIVHDLVEIKTGDVATFQVSEAELQQKAEIEHQALIQLSQELPSHTAKTLLAYESQADPESRFVRYIDKLLPILVDIAGEGERVLREDYQISSKAELSEKLADLQSRFETMFDGEFPEIDDAHQLLCQLLEAKLYT